MLKLSNILILLSLLTISTFSFDIKNIQHDIDIQDMDTYLTYVKTLLAQFTDDDLQINDKLKEIVQKQRISIFNTPQEIVLVLVDHIQSQNQLSTKQNTQKLNTFDNLFEQFTLINMAELDQETINKKITQLKSMGKLVHVLETSSEMAQKLTRRRLQQTEPLLVKQNGTDNTYILKFFFIFVFIIVCLASLSVIANMDNKKDTLLYAKFIADVGSR